MDLRRELRQRHAGEALGRTQLRLGIQHFGDLVAFIFWSAHANTPPFM
jgi:hypothetical protein